MLQILNQPTAEKILAKEDLIRIYSEMLRLRILDQRMLTLQRQGRIGFYGTATGEEAAIIGSAYALQKDDWIFPALRQGGAALLRGYPLVEYISQCMGNAADKTKGRQMPSHYCYRPANFVSWSSCIGTQIPHARKTYHVHCHRRAIVAPQERVLNTRGRLVRHARYLPRGIQVIYGAIHTTQSAEIVHVLGKVVLRVR